MTNAVSRRHIVGAAAALPFLSMPARAQAPSEPRSSSMSLQEKSARRQATDELLLKPVDEEIQAQSLVLDDFIAADYGATSAGKFLNVDKLFLRWAAPDWFEYIP